MTRGSAVQLLPGALVLALWVALMPADAGYFARDWGPAGLVTVGVWTVTVFAGGRLLPDGRALRVAVLALLAAVLVAFASIAWANAAGTAWATANQLLVVVLAVWVLALLPWRPGSAELLMGLFGVGAAVALGGALFSALRADELSSLFIEDRWASPIGYPNGLGNFGFFAAMPLLAISANPARSIPVKGAALGLATFLAGCALLPQSRGSAVGLLCALPVLIALSPLRWRVVARIVIAGAALALASRPIVDLVDIVEESDVVSGALGDAARAIVAAAAGATVAGLALAVVEARLRTGERTARVSRIAGVAAIAALALAAAGGAVVNADRIERVAEKQKAAWEKPQERYVDHFTERKGSRLFNPDPLQRYEYWHICLAQFADHPLGGIGAGGFERVYTKERAYLKYASFPHSTFMRVLAETGLLGVLAVLAFVGAVLFGLLRGIRAAGSQERSVVAGALAAAVLFAVHAQLDFLEEFPALAAPALGFLVVAMVVRRGAPADPPAGRGARLATVAAVVLGAVAFATIAFPYASLRYKERAQAVWRTDLGAAYRDLDRAAALDPLDDAPFLLEGTIALQKRDYKRARRAFEAALEREEGWLAHFEIALIESVEGDREAAMRQLATAGRQNPIEAAISAAVEEIGAGQDVDPVRLNKRLFESPLFNARRLT